MKEKNEKLQCDNGCGYFDRDAIYFATPCPVCKIGVLVHPAGQFMTSWEKWVDELKSQEVEL